MHMYACLYMNLDAFCLLYIYYDILYIILPVREHALLSLIHFFTWKPVKVLYANIADPDQMPHIVASDQGLHCLLTGFFIKTE